VQDPAPEADERGMGKLAERAVIVAVLLFVFHTTHSPDGVADPDKHPELTTCSATANLHC